MAPVAAAVAVIAAAAATVAIVVSAAASHVGHHVPNLGRVPLDTLEVLETVDLGDGVPFPRRVRVTLHEGRNHQVKRMLGACGASVDALCHTKA